MAEQKTRTPGSAPSERAFNFNVMSDDQVATLGRAIMLALEYESNEPGECRRTDESGLVRFFAEEMASLYERNPERARELLKRGALSNNEYDEEATARCAPALAQHDFPLARDVVVYLDGSPNDVAGDVAGEASFAMRQNAAPAQVADLCAALEAARQSNERVVPPGLAS